MAREVFLSYHSADRSEAKELKEGLEACGLKVFLAPEDLPPGAFWIPELDEQIRGTDAFLLLLTHRGPGAWQRVEYYQALDRKVKDPAFPLVPVLLPGAEPRPPFLQRIGGCW